MIELSGHIKANGWTQAEAAEHLGETQPRVSNLVNGHIERFSIDQLVTLLSRIGTRVQVAFHNAA